MSDNAQPWRDEFIKFDLPEDRPAFNTPVKDFEDVWDSGVDSPEINAVINKHVFLGFVEHFESLMTIDSYDEDTGHVAAALWAESFDGYQARIDLEKMFCSYDDHDLESLERYLGSFRRIVAHLEGLVAKEQALQAGFAAEDAASVLPELPNRLEAGDPITIGMEQYTFAGSVRSASPNGRSLLIEFEEGGGVIPVLQQDDGSYVARRTGASIVLVPRPQ